MRLEKASYKAIKYACMNFHYAKAVPVNVSGYSVFNDSKQWCGVVLFGSGANQHIASEFGLGKGKAVELVRMALNGKQESTTKAMSLALKLIRKDFPLVNLVISYADANQGHYGTIYQATNWYYIGEYADIVGKSVNGIVMHPRTIYSKYGTHSLEWLRNNVDANAHVVKGKSKFKYIYPLTKDIIPMCKTLSKPYPKKEITSDNSITANAASFQLAEGGQHHLVAQKTGE
jgi:hypothetical protein